MRTVLLFLAFFVTSLGAKVKVEIKSVSPQTEYAAQLLKGIEGKYKIQISVAGSGVAEGFTIVRKGKTIRVTGNDDSGAIYGVNKLLEIFRMENSLESIGTITEAPEMKLRGACIGLQKTVYLPGHKVYEYPYTPENFPWFYDKDLWIRYLDMLASDSYFDGDEVQRQFQTAINTLPEKQRLVFNLKYFDEMKYEDMSSLLGTSIGALKASYHHAVKKISAFFDDND